MKQFLLALCGFALLAIACQNQPALPAQTTTAPQPDTAKVPDAPIVGAATAHCYQLVEANKDVHSCQISTRATLNPYVSGYLDWSPFEKDGAHGILKNMRNEEDLLVADFTYMIEGSIQTEEVYFKMEEDKLTKMRGELREVKGKLVAKDRKKMKAEMVLPKVDCSKVAQVVKTIQDFEKQLQ